MELPLGWSAQVDPEGKAFYHCACTGESRWKHPDRYGPDQHAAVWRWELRDGQRRYLRVDASHSQLHPPRVGDGQVLPLAGTPSGTLRGRCTTIGIVGQIVQLGISL